MSAPVDQDWMPILSRLNATVLRSDLLKVKGALTEEALSTGWCGQPPASESAILEAESRLGIKLPPSYRSFLLISNGWRPFGPFMRLLPVQEIERFRTVDPEELALIQECYREDDISDNDYLDYENPRHMEVLRLRYYPDSILVGRPGEGESDMILLNPHIVFPNGEWEAIFFANWVPDNSRYRSFREWVVESVRDLESFEQRLPDPAADSAIRAAAQTLTNPPHPLTLAEYRKAFSTLMEYLRHRFQKNPDLLLRAELERLTQVAKKLEDQWAKELQDFGVEKGKTGEEKLYRDMQDTGKTFAERLALSMANEVIQARNDVLVILSILSEINPTSHSD